MEASGARDGAFTMGRNSGEDFAPWNPPAPITIMADWLKATFSFFSSNVSTGNNGHSCHGNKIRSGFLYAIHNLHQFSFLINSQYKCTIKYANQ